MNNIELERFGRVRSNPYAKSTNFVRFDDEICACAHLNACLDTVTKALAPNLTFVGFIFDGETFTPAVPIPVSNVDGILEYLTTKIGIKEFDLNIKVKSEGGNLVITHIGKLALTSVIFSDGAVNASRVCTIEVHCEYKALVAGTIPPLNDGTTSEALANNPYNYTGDPVQDAAKAATLKTDVETALGTLGVAFDSVAVVPNTFDESFEVTVTAVENTVLYFGNVKLKECNCKKVFIPAP